MSDECFGHPRLAAIYDPLDPDRSDLDAYVRVVEEFEARRVLDIGSGTGVFAADGQVLTSDSTLRFREREEVEADLVARGYVVEDVRDAPD
ncbi:hypothetical protein [Streptomyces sp. NPDC001435]|uniref:hypothetical protein n=1 Tax=unclassified Streptomyces TaxID=2593676 RepID=UPI00369AA54B